MSFENETTMLLTGPNNADTLILLAHGAGAGMDTPFMDHLADGLATEGIRTGRFEFPYMQRQRAEGKRRPPDRAPKLIDAWKDAIASAPSASRLVIGGKSMGGRIASMLFEESNAAGLICLGYPFHPTGKPDKLRIDHLQTLTKPCLFLQGERDPFGNRTEVDTYPLAKSIRLHWLADGDHSLKPRKASGVTVEENLDQAVKAMASFVAQLP